MRKLSIRKRVAAAVGATIIIGAATTTAYAFYSASIATAESDNSATIGDTTPLQTLRLSVGVPSLHLGESGDVVYKATNPNTAQAVHLNTVSAGAVTVDSAHSACPAGSFTLTDFESTGAQDIPGGATANVGYESLHYNNLSVNQNACLGASLTVVFSTT